MWPLCLGQAAILEVSIPVNFSPPSRSHDSRPPLTMSEDWYSPSWVAM